MAMASYRLRLFTWVGVDGSVAPNCPFHPESTIHVRYDGDTTVVICEGKTTSHLIKLCPAKEFEAERQEAAAFLSRGHPTTEGPPSAEGT